MINSCCATQRVFSSAGRATRLHRVGHRFDPGRTHIRGNAPHQCNSSDVGRLLFVQMLSLLSFIAYSKMQYVTKCNRLSPGNVAARLWAMSWKSFDSDAK